MTKNLLCLISALALVGVAGCGGTDMGTDDFGTNEGPDLAGAHLQSGTYNVLNPMTVSDGCMLAPIAMTTQVTNTQTMLSLGNQCTPTQGPQGITCSPGGYLLGTGPYTTASTATLTTGMQTITLTDGCTFTREDTSMVTFTGMNQLQVDWTHKESAYAASCPAADKPATDPCTSEFKFTLSM